MKKIFLTLIWSGCFFLFPAEAAESTASTLSAQAPRISEEKEEGIVLFTSPTDWHMADPNALPSHVRAMVVGNGPSHFPPSLNLSSEPYKGTLRQYLKIVKNMNSAQGYEWKDLGTIRTEAGNASLSQVDTKTQWGDTRLMHAILIKNGNVYILTASALKNEFSIFYKDFFAAMRSLRVTNDLYSMVSNPQQLTQLKTATEKLQAQWKILLEEKQKEYPSMALSGLQEDTFKSGEFQNTNWIPFKEMLSQKYGQLGSEWHSLFIQKLQEQLFNLNP
jgi:hypothetical protein